jgi:hypothetical protein
LLQLKICPPHIGHENGLGVRISSEITVHMSSNEIGHLLIVLGVEFGYVSDFAQESLSILFGVTIDKVMIL